MSDDSIQKPPAAFARLGEGDGYISRRIKAMDSDERAAFHNKINTAFAEGFYGYFEDKTRGVHRAGDDDSVDVEDPPAPTRVEVVGIERTDDSSPLELEEGDDE